MISAIVKDAHPTVNVEFRLPNLPDFTIEFVIDTGFTEFKNGEGIEAFTVFCCLPIRQENKQHINLTLSFYNFCFSVNSAQSAGKLKIRA